MHLHKLSLLALAAGLIATTAHAQVLTGWAQMPAGTFADGPTSGQFAAPNPYGTNLPPYTLRQPVQGFSGVLPGPRKNVFRFLVDNGFGAQGNSADALLRAYAVEVSWRTRHGGAGSVAPADWQSGHERSRFDARARLQLNDAQRRLTVPIQADHAHYYNNPANTPVDPAIRANRWLTGADFDIESFRQDRQGNYWFGDEFGPYLIKTDAHGTVLRSEISLPGVYAPQHKDVLAGRASANLPGSGGFEGMAMNKSGTRLYPLLERPVAGDPANLLRIEEFDLASEAYTGRRLYYPLDAQGTNIGDMVALDDHRFIVLERNGGTATTPATVPFKKVYLVDFEHVPSGGTVRKLELVNLMNVADPHDLNGDGSTVFTFPYVTIEDVLVLDERTLLVVNDNNYPYGGGRALGSDATEFLRIRLPVYLGAPRAEGERGGQHHDRQGNHDHHDD